MKINKETFKLLFLKKILFMSSSKKVAAIVQARVSSIRFPYKVLQKIGNKTAIQILLERLSFSKKIDKIVVAIPKDKKEKILKNHIVNLGHEVFEGHKTDLVDRYYKAAKKFKSRSTQIGPNLTVYKFD